MRSEESILYSVLIDGGSRRKEREFNVLVVVAGKKKGCKRDDDLQFLRSAISSISFYQFHGQTFSLFRAMSALSDVTNAAPVARGPRSCSRCAVFERSGWGLFFGVSRFVQVVVIATLSL